jgi:hypothetical protein
LVAGLEAVFLFSPLSLYPLSCIFGTQTDRSVVGREEKIMVNWVIYRQEAGREGEGDRVYGRGVDICDMDIIHLHTHGREHGFVRLYVGHCRIAMVSVGGNFCRERERFFASCEKTFPPSSSFLLFLLVQWKGGVL